MNYLFSNNTIVFSQDTNINSANLLDSIKNSSLFDSLKLLNNVEDSVQENSTIVQEQIKIADDQLEDVVNYKATDSIIYDIKAKTMYLYGNAYIQYQGMEMWSQILEYNWDNNEVFAKGSFVDSIGAYQKVFFTDDGKNYQADSAKYNFKTEKGKSYGLVTQELEGYLHADLIKAINDSTLYAKNARYTTCDLDHPHFFVEVNKAKVINDKLLVGKSANLVIEDVRTPLYLPFAFLPSIKSKGSGLIMPQYGQSNELGFYLSGLGYYWHINDKIDLTSTVDVYTLGSWRLNFASTYKKLYKYYGNLSFNISQIRSGYANEKRNPNRVKPPLNFGINWQMNLDQKRLYNSNFNINLNIVSSKKYQQITSTNANDFLSSSFSSNISYSKWWTGKPYRLSISARYNQNTQSRAVSLDLPQFNFNVSRINPFQKKISSTTKKWYENIGFSYDFQTANRINTYDSIFFTKRTIETMQNGIRHSLPISGNFKLFNYINFNVNFNYNERWHFSYIDKIFRDTLTYYDTRDSVYKIRRNVVETDTLRKFKTNRDFGLSFNFGTNLYGTFQFKNRKHVAAIRHTFRPSLNFNFRPDFAKSFWKSYKTVQIDTTGRTQEYSIFEQSLYGGPPSGKVGSIGMSFANTFEMKIKSKKDTITGFKKISLLDNLSTGLSYNLAAEKNKLNINPINASTHITERLNLSMSVNLDPYALDSNGTRTNSFHFKENRRLLRFESMNVSLNGSFSSKKRVGSGVEKSELEQQLDLSNSNLGVYDRQYYNFDIPWSVNYSYSLNWRKAKYNKKDTNIINQTLSLGLDFNLTAKWKVNISSGFDIQNKQITRTDISVIRDLHCWQLEMKWIPNSYQQGFFISIYVTSQQFRFLRLQKQKAFFDSGFFGSGGGFNTGGTVF
ncbi:MAG: LPS-assembly protein LptD [Chitinophagales bacterium]|nr:LPS-assembly protein LptD [Chitinophagales bacterium]